MKILQVKQGLPYLVCRVPLPPLFINLFNLFIGFRIFSPPPPRQMQPVPPVPPVPRQYRNQTSLPMRRHPPQYPSGIIRPSDRPLPFESNPQLGGPIQAANANNPDGTVRLPPLAPAAPSHHVPSMGLGGALLAFNRPDIHQYRRHNPQALGPQLGVNVQHPTAPAPGRASWIVDSLQHIFGGNRNMRVHRDLHVRRHSQPGPQDPFVDFPFSNADEHENQAFLAYLTAGEGDPASFFRDQSKRLRSFEPDYKTEYTHPGTADSGFTYDFAPSAPLPAPSSNSVIVIDDSPGPSTKAGSSSSSHTDDTNEILVCAHCTDALVTGDSVTGDERQRKRVWALRCGHVLDGKCVDALMKPTSEGVKGKGRADLDNLPGSFKSKGKVVEERDPKNIFSAGHGNSIRYRLRPRPGGTVNYSGMPTSDFPRPYRPLPYRRSQGGRGKGKGKVQAPVVQAEFHWQCPVAGCGKDHASWLVEGKWVPHDKEGAITIYV